MKKQDNAIIGIYKITNPKGKIYIGQSINIEKRKKRYEKHIKHMSSQPKIYNSILKYGWEQHVFEIIEECSIEQLNEKEVYWKQYYLNQTYNRWDMVLFCDLYDNGGGPLSEATKQKISKALLGSQNMLGKKHTEETKKLMSEKAKGKPKSETHKTNMKKPRSEQAKLNISEGKKGKPSPMKGKSRTYKGRISPNKGNTYNENTKGKIRERMEGNLYNAHPVKNTGNGMVWESKTHCALFYGVSTPTINNWIKLNKHNLIIIKENL
jgi:group I intron endonuclease